MRSLCFHFRDSRWWFSLLILFKLPAWGFACLQFLLLFVPSICFCVEGFDYTCTSSWATLLMKKKQKARKALFALWIFWQLNREFWELENCVFFWYIKHTQHSYMNASHYHPTITRAGWQDVRKPSDLGNTQQCYSSSGPWAKSKPEVTSEWSSIPKCIYVHIMLAYSCLTILTLHVCFKCIIT